MPVSINQVAINESIYDGSRELHPLQGAPSAFIQYITGMYIRTPIQVHHYEFGVITLPDKTPFADLKTNGDCVTHFFYQFFQGNFSQFYIRKHHQQRMLYQRKAGMCMQVRSGYAGNGLELSGFIPEKSFFS